MKYRKLRIAWSVAWGVVAVLLCVLWARSGQRMDNAMGRVFNLHFQFDTSPGTCWMGASTFERAGGPWRLSSQPVQDFGKYYPLDAADLSMWGRFAQKFGRIAGYLSGSIGVPFWFAIGITANISAAPLLRWRFSLRTLLIATTLVAVGLGVVVWLSR